jgi:hypothetical protein
MPAGLALSPGSKINVPGLHGGKMNWANLNATQRAILLSIKEAPIKSNQHRIEWIVAAGLVSGFMWWLGWCIVTAWSAGVPGFVEVFNFIMARVSGT